ncbi:hypothetical protein KDH_12510 [Dictyobacter sp. S3.2.2.5]|uniref:HTH cro/C1-type domain-containing protein n=1 Tax=Dictyobacter halimunensis TaxID=3026934 RepID=A0ABQ6FN15_9CHLR|nr:hypothetical protein KDH_12510 [Dictyobacter sp. S3.2.2.5]
MQKSLPFHVQLRRERVKRSLTQEDLASEIEVDAKTVSRWEQGISFPRNRHLKALYQLFNTDAEHMGVVEETAVKKNISPLHKTKTSGKLHLATSKTLEEQHQASIPLHEASPQAQDTFENSPYIHRKWVEAPHVTRLYGRSDELTRLRQWLEENINIIMLVGIGGTGKTALALTIALQLKHTYDHVLWYSLQSAPPLQQFLSYCLHQENDDQDVPPSDIHTQIESLMHLLNEHHCLLILDNFESILQPGQRSEQYLTGYEDYGTLIEQLGEEAHQSTILITGREKPEEVAHLEISSSLVRSMHIQGLSYQAGREFLKDQQLIGTDEEWLSLITHYSGNPLALRLVTEPIQELFGGRIARFLAEGDTIFGNIHDLLHQQFQRLSPQEQEILYWLAIEREAVPLDHLRNNLLSTQPHSSILETLNTLRRRSMIDVVGPASFTLQSVIMEYVTTSLIELFVTSFRTEHFRAWANYALVKMQARDYTTGHQVRIVLESVAQQLLHITSKEGIEQRLKNVLARQQEVAPHHNNYLAGNILNLLLYLRCDLRGFDFSRLVIRQACLHNVRLPDIQFKHAHFIDSTFASTSGNVLSVAFSPHGERLITGTAPGDIWIYEAKSGKHLLTCKGHHDGVWSIATNPDGQTFASSSDDWAVRLWDITTGQCLRTFNEHTNRVKSVAFSPDGNLLASGSEDQTIRIWDSKTGQCRNILRGHTDRIWSITFHPSGTLLASGSADETIRIWNIETGQCIRSLPDSTGWILAVAFSPNGEILASGGDNQVVRLWNIETGEIIQSLKGHNNRIRCLSFSPDNTLLASGSEDCHVRLWNVATGQPYRILTGHTHGVRSVAFNRRGDILASGGDDQTLILWATHSGHSIKTLQGHTNRVFAALFRSDQWLISCSEDHTFRLWDVQNAMCSKFFPRNNDAHAPLCMSFAPQKDLLASGGEDRTVRLWDIHTGICVKTLRGHSNWIRAIAFSPDGTILASGGEDLTIRLWDIETEQCVSVLKDHTGWIRALTFSPDGRYLASAGDDSTIYLWERATGILQAKMQGHHTQIRTLAFSPDSCLLASGGEDHMIYLWSIENTEHIHQHVTRLHGHKGRVRSLHFNADGTMLASGGDDRIIMLWNMHNREVLRTIQAHTKRIRWVHFSPDGHTLASSSDDGSIKLWDPHSGAHLTSLLVERPYEHMNITGVQGLTDAQKTTLYALGAYTDDED